MKLHQFFVACALATLLAADGRAAVVINEYQYDDGGTDDREFVELYNNGGATVDISGWIVRNSDTVGPPGDNNADFTIPAATMLPAGGYYVIGQTGVLNVNQVVTGTLENDNEAIQLLDAASVLQDTVIYELNKGAVAVSPAEGGIFGNANPSDRAGTPLNATISQGRFIDGRDTNSNGRDFGIRPSTPGTTNAPGGIITAYAAPDPSSLAVGADMPGTTGNFVNAKVIDPTVVDANNLNAIAAPPGGGKAYSAGDPSGGGNGVTSNAVFSTTAMSFKISAYLDTRDLPVQTTTTTSFRGSEVTFYGLGGGDPLTNLTDISGQVGLGPGTLPGADTANGFSGIVWLYEKVGQATAGGPVSEKLYLLDANDGGDASTGGNTPLDWIVLTTVDLSGTTSGWFNLGIAIDASGNIVAEYDGQIFNHTTSTNLHSGAFNVGYRENLQNGSDGTPDLIMRMPTFTIANVPESSWIAALGMTLVGASVAWGYRRRTNKA